MEKPKKETVLKLAESVPEVKLSLDFYDKGKLTWEEALMGCVIVLADELERYRSMYRRKSNYN
jgi:hypothetical protein